MNSKKIGPIKMFDHEYANDVIDLDQHGHDMGGDWVTQHMMDQRMMGGGGMMGADDMMGFGWAHENGNFGMIFNFTTR